MTNSECGMGGGAQVGGSLSLDGRRGMKEKMMSQELKDRTKALALRIIRLVEVLPRGTTADVIGRQLVRAGTSVAANYRAACRAKSRKDFVAKMGTVEEECDESLFWMELVVEAEFLPAERLADLMAEADEILSIVIASQKTAREVK